MSSCLPLLVAGLLTGGTSTEQPRLRSLCIDAPVVVLTRPEDPVTPLRFRVLRVLRGDRVREGDVLTPVGLTAEQVRSFDEPDLAEKKPRPRRIDQALLFLTGLPGKERLLPGGMRLCTIDGRALAPRASGGPELIPGVGWAPLVQRVTTDVTAVDQLQASRKIALPGRRVRALLDWLIARKAELSVVPPEQPGDLTPIGWGRLTLTVFDWILESGSPADVWPAIALYAELNRGEIPEPRWPTFASPAGRDFLLRLARDDRPTLGERIRALRILAWPITLWPSARDQGKGAVLLGEREQESLLDQLGTLLGATDFALRGAVIAAIVTVSHPHDPELARRRSDRLVPALVSAYRAAAIGEGRDVLSQAICTLATPSQWKELTGNPPGTGAWLSELDRDLRTLTFWLTLRAPGGMVHEPPVLRLERLGPLGVVLEVTRVPVKPLYLEGGWAAGWNPQTPLPCTVDVAFQPSTHYRIRVEGSLGKGTARQTWVSEPHPLQTPAKEGDPPSTGSRIRKR